MAALLLTAGIASADEGLDLYEKKIRPLLAERCYGCHSVAKNKSKGGLTLDTRTGLEKGGETGPVLVPGKPDGSRLIRAVEQIDPDLEMPPAKAGGKLPDQQIADLVAWVRRGAAMPADRPEVAAAQPGKAHWAYQPVKQPRVPRLKAVRNDVDAFVRARLAKSRLSPAPPASREALIRRVSYDLIGLPPTLPEVNAFVGDRSRDAFEKVVDRLLGSPRFGERWARHWLDTARYSDTTGLISNGGKYRFEDFRYAYAWTYRDYVIRAFNEDLPYDRFLVEQLAADRLPDIRPDDPRLAALGFLNVGKRFNSVDDVIDERIDTVSKAMLGLTVSCARCHDHKFDPIPTADYYSLHGIFASTTEPYDKPTLVRADDVTAREDYEQKLAALDAKNRDFFYEHVRMRLLQFQDHAEGYLSMVAHPVRSTARYEVAKKYGLWPEEREVVNALRPSPQHPVLGPFAQLAKLPAAEFAAEARPLIAKILASEPVNPLIADALRPADPKSMADVAKIYAAIFARARKETERYFKERTTSVPDLAAVIETPYRIPTVEEIATSEQLMTLVTNSGQRRKGENGYAFEPETARKFLFPDINELRMTHPGAPGAAMVLYDSTQPRDSYVQLRGERARKGPVVPRRFLEVMSTADRPTFTEGSGRLELAKAIARPDNPLTARVLVNRVWMNLFGAGFVRTPDDLGAQSEPPSHPELLDHLASRFVAEGWSVKKLIRLVVLSDTYRQASETNRAGETRDAQNRLLWRQNMRRLDFEAIRDTMVFLTGRLDHAIGGKPVNLTEEPYSYRRSIYGYVDRLALSDIMTQFDFSDPSMANTVRVSTIVPQQALFFMNSPMSIDVARQLVNHPEVAQAGDDLARVRALYTILFQRAPRPDEVRRAREFVAAAQAAPPAGNDVAVTPLKPRNTKRGTKYASVKNEGERVTRAPLTPWELYAQALLCTNEFVYVN